MSDEDLGVCGATSHLPPDFVELERRVTGNDWSGVTVTCFSEPHDDGNHVGLLLLDDEEHGTRYWSDPAP